MATHNGPDEVRALTTAGSMGMPGVLSRLLAILLVLAGIPLSWWLIPARGMEEPLRLLVLSPVFVFLSLLGWAVALKPGTGIRWDTERLTVNGWFGSRSVRWADVRLLEDRSSTRLLIHKGDGGTVTVNWGGVDDPGLLTEVLRTHLSARFIEAASREAFRHTDPCLTAFPDITGKPVVSTERIAWRRGKAEIVVLFASLLCVERDLRRVPLESASLTYTFHSGDGSEARLVGKGQGFLVLDDVIRRNIPSHVPLWDFTSHILLPTAADLSADPQRLAVARRLGARPQQKLWPWVLVVVCAGWLLMKLPTGIAMLGILFVTGRLIDRHRPGQRSRIIAKRLGLAGVNASR